MLIFYTLCQAIYSFALCRCFACKGLSCWVCNQRIDGYDHFKTGPCNGKLFEGCPGH